ncbi:VOC family protein [Symmachiella dynata]|uniref:VOC family protein n=1 Tax=Symmachiella dynata TaxID=2527995 RepID=UPI0030EC0963
MATRTRTEYANGQFCWVDLMTNDVTAAQEFYGELLGWESAKKETPGGPPYRVFTIDDLQVAGMGAMNDEMKSTGMPPIWNSYINVDDITASTRRAQACGGTVLMEPFQIMDAGHMAIISDPSGAVVSFWQGLDHFGAEMINDPGCWSWNELLTDNVGASLEFYGGLFGWAVEKEESDATSYWTFQLNDRPLAGMLQKTPEMGDIPSCWGVYFSVADIQATTARVVQLGGTICQPPFEVSVGHISIVSDPQGAVFDLIQMTVPVDD